MVDTDPEESSNCSGSVPLFRDARGNPAADGGERGTSSGRWRLEAIFRALTSQRRRYVLYALQEREVTDLETLATVITAQELGVPTETVSETEIDRRKTQLRHNDLPKLEDAALVEYDPRSNTVRYDYPPALLDSLLEVCADVDTPNQRSE